ncbi:MAG: class I SAM-dependent methyltransferase [Cyanobacteria bacterium P01_D01_bin.123]
MSQSPKFWDRIAASYAKQPIVDETSYQKKPQVTHKYFRPDMGVLEFGCGTGSTAIIHAPHVKYIHAIDISSKMLEIDRTKADIANVENITSERKVIEEL